MERLSFELNQKEQQQVAEIAAEKAFLAELDENWLAIERAEKAARYKEEEEKRLKAEAVVQAALSAEKERLRKVAEQKKQPKWFVKGENISYSKRLSRTEWKLKMVLDFLRYERFSTREIIELVLGVKKTAAHDTLNMFVDQGYLLRDDIPWSGCPKPVQLFSVSNDGLYHLWNEDENDVVPREANVMKIKATRKEANIEHLLNIQKARLWLTRFNNPYGEHRRWRLEKDLPYANETKKKNKKINPSYALRWPTYPDAVIENSHFDGKTIAVEMEHSSKGERYTNLLRAHKMNMSSKYDSPNYDGVLYFRSNIRTADHLKEKSFYPRIEKNYTDPESEECQAEKNSYIFDIYTNLPERIRAIESEQ